MSAQIEFDFEAPAASDLGYIRWLQERANRKKKRKKTLKQVELPQAVDETGFLKFRSEQAEFIRSCEQKWGVIIGAPVKASLSFLDQPVRGIIRLQQPDPYEPTFEIRDLLFSASDVLNIVRE